MGPRQEGSLRDEIQSHIDMQTDDNLRAGMSPSEARRQARLKFGDVESAKEEYRDGRGLPVIETFVRDVRYGLRMLAWSPGFAAVCVLTLALGIGANSALFSFINAILLRGLPVRAPDELVWIGEHIDGDRVTHTFSYRYYELLRDHASSFSGVAATAHSSTGLTVGDTTEQIPLSLVTGEYFPLLGVQAEFGRLLLPSDDSEGADRVVVLRHAFWRNRFGADPAVIGRRVLLGGQPFLVVGVAAAGFEGMNAGSPAALWAPMSHHDVLRPGGFPWRSANATWLQIFARMAPGVSLEQARIDAKLLYGRYGDEIIVQSRDPKGRSRKRFADATLRLDPARALPPGEADYYQSKLSMLFGSVAFLLLIACANLANLLLARGAKRRHEMAVRLATGASAARLVRQLLTEAGILGLLGGGTGLLIAWAACESVVPLLVGDDAVIGVSPDPAALAFTILISFTAVFAAALFPALALARLTLASHFKGGAVVGTSHRSLGARGWFATAQFALCLPLMVGAGLLLQSVYNLTSQDFGFERRQRVQTRLDAAGAGYDRERSGRFFGELLRALQQQPGIDSVGFSSKGTLSGYGSTRFVYSDTPGHDRSMIDFSDVSEGYFETLGVPLLAGRDFTKRDDGEAPLVMVINQALATTLYGDADPIGRQIFWDPEKGPAFTVVGVVADAKYNDIRKDPRPVAYTSFRQSKPLLVFAYVRTPLDVDVATVILREQVARLDPYLPVSRTHTLDDQIESLIRQDRVVSLLVTGFGVLALSLSAIGLYGVLAFDVGARTREVGLRMALGAQRGQILANLFRRSARWVFGGTVVGLALAAVLTRLLESLLYGLSPLDPGTFVSSALFLLGCAAFAVYLPARRAAGINPLSALRHE